MCDGAALEGLSLISKSLITAVEEPKNIVARGGMHVGSCLAGISFFKRPWFGTCYCTHGWS